MARTGRPRGFDRDAASPVLVAVTAPASDGAAVQAYRDELATVAGDGATVSVPQPLGNVWRIDVEPSTPRGSKPTTS